MSRCAVAIVGQRLNDQGYACGAKAFIADFFIIISATNRCLVDCALYVVFGHGLRLGGVDREAQTRVHVRIGHAHFRSEEHTSDLQSLMRISYAVVCLKQKTHNTSTNDKTT